MPTRNKTIRQSISIPEPVIRRVRGLAKSQKTSANRVLVDLIEAGLASQEAEKARFFELANQLSETRDRTEREKLKRELARITFGK